MRALLASFSWQELRHHPWRNAAAALAVMLGVALAFSVHLINASALSEFSSAVRSVNGQPDLELRAVREGFDEALYGRVANHPLVAFASPVVEVATFAATAQGRKPLRVLGVDALIVPAVAPALMPTLAAEADRLALFAPDMVFLNPAAQAMLGAAEFQLQAGLRLRPVKVAGRVAAAGGPLAVMDIAAAQELFGRIGLLSRIDVRLRPGADPSAFLKSLQLAPDVTAAAPGDDTQRIDSLSRAYRVNLTVLALVALFTGAFLVFSVLALSVSRRARQFALLGVLGLSPRERLGLVLAESALLGLAGSAAGVALGSGLAAAALKLLGGDLGGGYFPGVIPTLQWSGTAAAAYGALGVVAAVVGGWGPARTAQQLALAPALKGLGLAPAGKTRPWHGAALLAAAGPLALVPPVAGIPLAAYASIGLLLVGGISALPVLVAIVYDRLAPRLAHRLLPLLAVERARRVRETAAVAISGVVAALSLAVALTVMVASFRDSVARWLDVVLPADLYVRTAVSTGAGDTAFLDPGLVQAIAQSPDVQAVNAQRTASLLLDAARPPVALIARTIGDASRSLPLVAQPLPVPDGMVGIYVSEAMVDLYGARPGAPFDRLSEAIRPLQRTVAGSSATFFVAGVWRDYVRQSGAITLERDDYQRLTGDLRVNDLAIVLAPGSDPARAQRAIRELAAAHSASSELLEFASAGEIRRISLRIFDRSFAVTYWLQAVAIAIGIFGVAASFSAQVLARRKEFGLLAHLGLTRRQILAVVAGEGAAWTALGSIAGLLLGLTVAVVLVHVVNPQSFHWTMDLLVPWMRLLALCAAVMTAGIATAWISGRAAASRDAVLAVKDDW